jgi:hypothetical protein
VTVFNVCGLMEHIRFLPNLFPVRRSYVQFAMRRIYLCIWNIKNNVSVLSNSHFCFAERACYRAVLSART